MKLSQDQVLHIAELAKLALTKDETELFAEQLSQILDYFEMLNELDTSALPPTAQAIYRSNVMRDDQVRPGLPTRDALANAPQREGGYFWVKPILDQ
jgi:aspartyl-tRNA(Asn)/glutamyl-tRNA(Gln) amidotransferase subunit C